MLKLNGPINEPDRTPLDKPNHSVYLSPNFTRTCLYIIIFNHTPMFKPRLIFDCFNDFLIFRVHNAGLNFHVDFGSYGAIGIVATRRGVILYRN